MFVFLPGRKGFLVAHFPAWQVLYSSIVKHRNSFRSSTGYKILTNYDTQLDRIEKDSDRLCK